MDDDLIIFEENNDVTRKDLEAIEYTLRVLSMELYDARREIASLKEQLNAHINSSQNTESRSSRFRITHIAKPSSIANKTLSSENVLIDI
jgi:hypothetical protein